VSADEKAVDVALEITKQIIAISTAILALTGIFFEHIDGMTHCQRTLLGATWIAFSFAVLLGLITLMIGAGGLAGNSGLAVVKRRDLKLISAFQILAFFAAVLLMLIFALGRLSSPGKMSPAQSRSHQEKSDGKTEKSVNVYRGDAQPGHSTGRPTP